MFLLYKKGVKDMAKDRLYNKDEDYQETLDDGYNDSGFYPDIGWSSDTQEQDEIYCADEDYPEYEPVIVPVMQPTGKKRIDVGDKLPTYKKDKEECYGKSKAANRKSGRKK